jgi:TRAP-type C4-dicarboxylate transport system permease small subunit
MWEKIKYWTAMLLGWVSVGVLLVLVLDVLWGVFTRKILGEQARWSEELARFLLIWVSFLGGAIAYLDDKHLGVELLAGRLDVSARRMARVITHGVVFAFSFFVMGIGGAQLVADRWDSGQMLPALQISRAWFYLAVPVSGFLISLFALGNSMFWAFGGRDEEPARGGKEVAR